MVCRMILGRGLAGWLAGGWAGEFVDLIEDRVVVMAGCTVCCKSRVNDSGGVRGKSFALLLQSTVGGLIA